MFSLQLQTPLFTRWKRLLCQQATQGLFRDERKWRKSSTKRRDKFNSFSIPHQTEFSLSTTRILQATFNHRNLFCLFIDWWYCARFSSAEIFLSAGDVFKSFFIKVSYYNVTSVEKCIFNFRMPRPAIYEYLDYQSNDSDSLRNIIEVQRNISNSIFSFLSLSSISFIRIIRS